MIIICFPTATMHSGMLCRQKKCLLTKYCEHITVSISKWRNPTRGCWCKLDCASSRRRMDCWLTWCKRTRARWAGRCCPAPHRPPGPSRSSWRWCSQTWARGTLTPAGRGYWALDCLGEKIHSWRSPNAWVYIMYVKAWKSLYKEQKILHSKAIFCIP